MPVRGARSTLCSPYRLTCSKHGLLRSPPWGGKRWPVALGPIPADVGCHCGFGFRTSPTAGLQRKAAPRNTRAAHPKSSKILTAGRAVRRPLRSPVGSSPCTMEIFVLIDPETGVVRTVAGICSNDEYHIVSLFLRLRLGPTSPPFPITASALCRPCGQRVSPTSEILVWTNSHQIRTLVYMTDSATNTPPIQRGVGSEPRIGKSRSR